MLADVLMKKYHHQHESVAAGKAQAKQTPSSLLLAEAGVVEVNTIVAAAITLSRSYVCAL